MNTIEVFGKLHDFISQSALFALLGLIFIFFGIASFILIFHWNRYAVDKSAIIAAQAIYFLGGAFILLIGFISVLLY